MRRLVFLDFDGVIATSHSYYEATARLGGRPSESNAFEVLDRALCANVEQLCVRSGAKIVLSTTWREFHSLPTLRRWLSDYGIQTEIIGRTPSWPFGRRRKMSEYAPRNGRTTEIMKWVEENGRPSDEFVILDDDRITEFTGRWVQTFFDDDEGTRPAGFTRAHLDRALALFGVSPGAGVSPDMKQTA